MKAKQSFQLEPDDEQFVWAATEADARRFFGTPNATVRVEKERPTNAREIERYNPNAKLFAVKVLPFNSR